MHEYGKLDQLRIQAANGALCNLVTIFSVVVTVRVLPTDVGKRTSLDPNAKLHCTYCYPRV
jgi:hypothetical protein